MCAVSKFILMQCGLDGKEACGNKQLCTGLDASIKVIMLSSDTDSTLPTSLTNVTAAVLASFWNMASAAREVGLLASAMMTRAMNGPTFAALLSPTHES